MAVTQEQLVWMKSQVLIAISKIALAIKRLDKWLNLNKSDQQFMDVEAEKLELEAELMLLDAKLAALEMVHKNRLKSPDPVQKQRIAKLSKQVKKLQKNQDTADVLIPLASQLVALGSAVRALGNATTN